MIKPITIYTPPDDENYPPHITAEDDAFIYHQLLGGQDGIFGLSCTKIDNNTVQITGGGCTNLGHVLRVFGENNLTLDTGTAGYRRIDFIVARFTRGGGENPDTYELDVVPGTPYTGTTPVYPSLTTSNLETEGDINEVALFEVQMNGTNLENIVQDMANLPHKILIGTADPSTLDPQPPNGTIYLRV